MPRPLLFLFAAALVLSLSACAARKAKSAPSFYEGDAPSIHMTGKENAGGPLGGQ